MTSTMVGGGRRSRLYRVLSLGGYVQFNLPRTVTATAALLLTGLAGSHLYVLAGQPDRPLYFVAYCGTVAAVSLLAGAMAWWRGAPSVRQGGWRLGSFVSAAALTVYLTSRVTVLPGLAGVTGRWDFAPGTLTMACAAGFLAVHLSVLTEINVAFGQQRYWFD